MTSHEDEVHFMKKIEEYYGIEVHQLSNFDELVDTFKRIRAL